MFGSCGQEGGTVDLRDWQVNAFPGLFQLYLPIPDGVNLASADVPAYTPVVAMVAWLNSIKATADSDVPADLSSVTGRTFTFQTTQAFALSDPELSYVNDHLAHIILRGTGVRRDLIAAELVEDVDVTGQVVDQPNPFGAIATALAAKQVVLGTSFLSERNRSPQFTVRNQDSPIEEHVHVGSFRVVDQHDQTHPTPVSYTHLPSPRDS